MNKIAQKTLFRMKTLNTLNLSNWTPPKSIFQAEFRKFEIPT